MKYCIANSTNLKELKNLAINVWGVFEKELTLNNWLSLKQTLEDDNTYSELLSKSTCFICKNENEEIVGMSFLVSSGNPTEIYKKDWSYIRFVSVDPKYTGLGIGRKLTEMCMLQAKQNNEKTIALHTSEMMLNAISLYENLGFKVLKEIDSRLGKKYWLYTLDIS